MTGNQVLIADAISTDNGFVRGAFSVSETGMLAYRTGSVSSKQQLVWFDRTGNEIGRLGSPDENIPMGPQISPEGKNVSVSRGIEGGDSDIYLLDVASGALNRFTFDALGDLYPTWSYDGSKIYFSSNRQGVYDLYSKVSSGAGSVEILKKSTLNKFPYDVSPDGDFLLYMQVDPETNRDLWILPLSGEAEAFPFVNSEHHERNGYFSPDGRWVAYQSNEAGHFEVYVQPFPNKDAGKWQISTGGGSGPRWSGDGKEIFYITPNGTLMAVPILDATQTFEHGVPEELFQTHIVRDRIPQREEYDIAPDGRILINIITDDSIAPPINVVINWSQVLEK